MPSRYGFPTAEDEETESARRQTVLTRVAPIIVGVLEEFAEWRGLTPHIIEEGKPYSWNSPDDIRTYSYSIESEFWPSWRLSAEGGYWGLERWYVLVSIRFELAKGDGFRTKVNFARNPVLDAAAYTMLRRSLRNATRLPEV